MQPFKLLSWSIYFVNHGKFILRSFIFFFSNLKSNVLTVPLFVSIPGTPAKAIQHRLSVMNLSIFYVGKIPLFFWSVAISIWYLVLFIQKVFHTVNQFIEMVSHIHFIIRYNLLWKLSYSISLFSFFSLCRRFIDFICDSVDYIYNDAGASSIVIFSKYFRNWTIHQWAWNFPFNNTCISIVTYIVIVCYWGKIYEVICK